MQDSHPQTSGSGSNHHQILDEGSKALDKDHVDTRCHALQPANSLYQQQKYTEAEVLVGQAGDGQEKILGKEHVDSKHWLAFTRYQQQKYVEAEDLFGQAIRGQEKVLGKEHVNTLKSKH